MKKTILYVIATLIVVSLISADIIIDKYATEELAEDALNTSLISYEDSLPKVGDISEDVNYKKVTLEPICTMTQDIDKCIIELDVKCPDGFVCMNDGWIRQPLELPNGLSDVEMKEIIKTFVKDKVIEMIPEPVIEYDYDIKSSTYYCESRDMYYECDSFTVYYRLEQGKCINEEGNKLCPSGWI